MILLILLHTYLPGRNNLLHLFLFLYMLVMQAVVAVEKFLDTKIAKEKADEVFRAVLASKENVVLTGMPGSGKSTVGKLLNMDGFSFVDTDAEIEKRCGCTIKELIEKKGESCFRDLESEVIADVSKESGMIIDEELLPSELIVVKEV
mgnify:CR=1 FL=1